MSIDTSAGEEAPVPTSSESFSRLDSSLLLTSFVLTLAGAAAPENSKVRYALLGGALLAYIKPAVSAMHEDGPGEEPDPEILRQHNTFGEL
jgi:hypothetical protein